MKDILMPRISVNDDNVTIAQWVVKDGDVIKRKQLIAVLETTKETKELFSGFDGKIIIKHEEGEEVEVGALIAEIDETGSDSSKEIKHEIVGNSNKVDFSNVTEKARALIEEFKIDFSLLPKDKLIREKDVREIIQKLTNKEAEEKLSLSNHVYILGTGGFCREIITIINQTHAYTIDGIIGGIGDLSDKGSILGVPIIANTSNMDSLKNSGINKMINAVAVTPGAFSRKDIYSSIKAKGYECPNIIHNTAVIGTNVKMGEGNIIFAGAIIGAEATLGNDCVINVNSTISHECKIGSGSHIASGATLAGKVTVGQNSLIGQNVTIYNDVHIGNNVVIMNGLSVFKDVPDNTILKN